MATLLVLGKIVGDDRFLCNVYNLSALPEEGNDAASTTNVLDALLLLLDCTNSVHQWLFRQDQADQALYLVNPKELLVEDNQLALLNIHRSL